MDCAVIQGDLLAYHFAVAAAEERARIEAHLLECTTCLRAYLALKAHVERTDEAGKGPSEESRLRLRAAVEERFRPTPGRRLRRWLARPIPRYQSLAVAAAVILVAALAPAVSRQLGQRATADATGRVDTSRTTAESLSIY
jgi:short subunit dehydrogenase-like uncharacterized protein